ncbi:MAG: hypothetical protein HUJ68_07160 [Clostridia bacterium]|nr:hypothetical protein [Clostridia bacterium]
MDEWLNSGSKEAKQLQADLTNLKANIGSALAPAIQSVLQIFYKILAVVGAIVKSFANINIFAKKTAKSTASTASSTKAASNNLAKFDDLDVLQKDSGADSGGISPTDLSALMAQYDSLAEKIKNIFAFIFEPFKKAWETTGQTVISSIHNAFNGLTNLFGAIGSSFAKIWTNGTVQTTIEIILNLFSDLLNIIGNIGTALANAWKNNGNGDKLVQVLADAFNDLLWIIEDIVRCVAEWIASPSVQNFLNAVVGCLTVLGDWLQKITGMLKDVWENGGSEMTSKLLDAFSKIAEMVMVALQVILQALTPFVEWLLGILKPAIAGVIEAISFIIDALNGVLDFIIGVFTGNWELAWQGIKDFFARNMECNKSSSCYYLECNLFYYYISC